MAVNEAPTMARATAREVIIDYPPGARGYGAFLPLQYRTDAHVKE
jgi:hypothetical protein